MKRRVLVTFFATSLLLSNTLNCVDIENVVAATKKIQWVNIDGSSQNMSNLKRTVSKSNSAQNAIMKAWDYGKTQVDLSAYNISADEIYSIYYNLLENNPHYFYVGSFGYYIGSDGKISILVIEYNYSQAEISKMKKEYNQTINYFLKGVNKNWSDFEKALYAHDFLTKNCRYNYDESIKDKFNAYNALVSGYAVCNGYALAYEELCSQLGLECIKVSSAKLNHAWNMVKINNKWYMVDVTWDDLDIIDGSATHKFFLKSNNYFQSSKGEHVASDYETSTGIKGSSATSTMYDNYFWNNVYSTFDYVSGKWYGYNGKGSISQYSYSNSNFKESQKISTIKSDMDYFHCIGTGSYNNIYYYSLENSIYRLDLSTKKSTEIYSLNSNEKNIGSLAGFRIAQDGTMYYMVTPDPYSKNGFNYEHSLRLEINSNNSSFAGTASGNKGNNSSLESSSNKTSTAKKVKTSGTQITSTKRTGRGKKLVLKWETSSKVSGYQIAYSTNKDYATKYTKKVTVKKNKTSSKTLTNLNASKKYYVKIRCYKSVTQNAKKVNQYSAWSKSIKINK